MIIFELRNQNNASFMIYNSIYNIQILPEVIKIRSFEVSRKLVVYDWLEVTIDSSVWCLCSIFFCLYSIYLDALNVILSSKI